MCPSGSTVDFSADGPRFEPHYSSRRSRGAAARAKARAKVRSSWTTLAAQHTEHVED